MPPASSLQPPARGHDDDRPRLHPLPHRRHRRAPGRAAQRPRRTRARSRQKQSCHRRRDLRAASRAGGVQAPGGDEQGPAARRRPARHLARGDERLVRARTPADHLPFRPGRRVHPSRGAAEVRRERRLQPGRCDRRGLRRGREGPCRLRRGPDRELHRRHHHRHHRRLPRLDRAHRQRAAPARAPSAHGRSPARAHHPHLLALDRFRPVPYLVGDQPARGRAGRGRLDHQGGRARRRRGRQRGRRDRLRRGRHPPSVCR